MSNGLLYLAGVVAMALAALFAVPYFVDWNGYRGVFEEEATRILGREVRVGGNVNVRLLPSPYVSFEKLRIADPTGATGEPFFRADSFTMRLSVPPLLKGIIEANEIVLEKPVVRLAVDAEGGGNWRSFSIAPGALPFVPAGVSLQSVKITDGVIALHGPKGLGFAEIDGLDGELKAESMAGPFAFKGTADWQGGEREVRVATAAADADGSIRFKATVRGESASQNNYVVDGRLQDLKGRPRLDGEITAKLMPAGGELPVAPGGKDGAPLVDFKAKVTGDAMGLRLDDIAVSFDRVGQPQLIAGSAVATWSDTLDVNLALASRWLDLDRVAKGGKDDVNPLDTARNFIVAMMESLPAGADSKVGFTLDQATLGGEAVSDVEIEVARKQGTLSINRLRAGLPGGARVALDGTVDAAAANQAFRGDVTLHGTSLARFLDWAVREKSLAAALRNEGPFSVQGKLALGDGEVKLTDAGAEIGGRSVTGAVRYVSKDRRRLEVTLDGREIDAAQFWTTGVGALKTMLVGDKARPAGDQSKAFAWLDPAQSDFHLRLRAGELVTQHGRLRDVDMDVGLEQGRLALRTCKLSTSDGLQAELEGDVADVTQDPRGAVRWVIGAPTKDAYAALLRLLDLDETSRAQTEPLAALTPMRLAGSVQLGHRQPGAADISVDGSVQNGARLVARARLDGGIDDWRAAPADISVTIDGADVASVVSGFSGHAAAGGSAASPVPGEIFFKAVGVPDKAMTASTSARAQGLFLGYDGRLTLAPQGGRRVDGDLRVSARGLSDVMSMVGLGGGAALAETPVVGTFRIVSNDHAVELQPRDLTIGGSRIDGSVALSYPSEGLPIVTGEVAVDAATVPGLLGGLLDRKQTAEAPGAEPLAAGKTIWPEHGFDFAAVDGVEGRLGVNFASLELTSGMAVRNARAEIAWEPGKVTVTKLGGKVLQGELASQASIERAPGGASIAGSVRIDDMQITQPADAAAKPGLASLDVSFSGRASTPGGFISIASGKGELKLGEMSMRAPTPLAIVATSEAVLSGEASASGEQLVAALRAQIDASNIPVGPRTIGIEIADGAAKLALVTLDSPAGITKVETTVDLASLVVDSAWLAEPKAPDVPQPDKPRGGALPSVGVVYTGPLAKAWSLQPYITAEPLERELAIRKLELDADQLERLRKADTERARRDEERRRAVESDLEGSAPPPPSAATPPTVDVQPPSTVNAPADVPAVPPSSASAPGLLVPPGPGQELQTVAPVPDAASTGAIPPGEAGPAAAPQSGNYRPRRPKQQVPVGEQVLRALQNSAN